MWVNKRTYQDLLAAHKREVDILVSWIEQLQMQVGAPSSPREQNKTEPLSEHPVLGLYVGEEEEALIDAHAQELIDDEQLQQGLAELGRLNATV